MIELMKSGDKKKLLAKLEEQFGIKELPYALFRLGRERIDGYSGHLSIGEIISLAQVANVERIGLYLFKEDEKVRLGFDATQVLGEQITDNVFEIDDIQTMHWMAGEDIEAKAPKGTIVIKNGKDFLGCGKSNGEKIVNHVPKERRIKNRNI